MSTASSASVAALSKDALRGSASASVASSAGLPALAASSSSSLPLLSTLERELASVKQQLADVLEEIKEAKDNRKACVPGDDLWKEYTSELKQLRTKEEQLRDELKRKEVALERAGESHTQ